jgi:hypothetical protein
MMCHLPGPFSVSGSFSWLDRNITRNWSHTAAPVLVVSRPTFKIPRCGLCVGSLPPEGF